jgi:predicted AlkP superfamily phosphohydrolase/phosphomutase
MVTGYNAGRHGIFHFSKALSRSDAGAGWSPVTASDRKKDPFWRRLSAAGQRVGVINVPITYPADSVNGFVLAGMDSPGLDSPGSAHPPGLLDELRKQGIDYVIDVPNLRAASRNDPKCLPDFVTRMIEARARAVLHLMRSRDWDALMAVFVATDRVQHYFWPADLSKIDSPDWNPIRSVYRQIDDFFGRALSLVDENTTVLVVSDHGFGPLPAAKRGLNQLFAELGLLRFRQSGAGIKSRALKNLLLSGRRLLPYSLQDRLARSLPALHLRAVNELSYSIIDWSETKVYASPQGGRVWINLEGRKPDAVVPQSEYDRLRQQVRGILSSLTDPLTGRRIVRAAHNREDIFHGPDLEQSADIVIEWDYGVIKDSLSYRDGGRSIIVSPRKDNRRGNRWKGSHRPEGILIACGPHVKQGMSVADAVIYDIAPTVLYLHGLAVPDDMDGRVLTGIFTEASLQNRPVQRCEPSSAGEQKERAPLDAQEARRLEERLRGLGYIE